MSGGHGLERDPGLQPERTRLAWRRTTLACTVGSVLAVKAALGAGPSLVPLLICALCLILWLSLIAVAHHRIRALTAAIPRQLDQRLVIAAAVCTVALALCGTAVVI